jgi:hypothetical protein
MIAGMFLLRYTIFVSELISFFIKKDKVIQMIEIFCDLEDTSVNDERNKLCVGITQRFKRAYAIITVLLTILNVFVYEKVQFFVPVVYEAADKYSWFSFVHLFYLHHCAAFITIAISIDVLPIISVLKLEGLVASLCRRIEEVTSGNLRENEQKLDDCIKFHVKVLK